MLRRLVVALFAAGAVLRAAPAHIHFVFTADAHYGLTRTTFRGASNVPAHIVNMALVAKVNGLPEARFPDDGGIDAGQPIRSLDFLVEGGDTANREEGTGAAAIQRASVSWSQFVADYFDGLSVKTDAGDRAPLYVVPGNHEASNAVGFYKPMTPPTDRTPMVDMFNRMLRPATPKTDQTFTYDRDRVLYSHDVGGVHFVFLQVWPDSSARTWLTRDLASVLNTTPVVIFVHEQPDAEAKHFKNPNGPFNVNAVNQFENLLSDTFADGRAITERSTIEQTDLETFLREHRNVTAYFHGHSNWNEFYDWAGPRRSLALHVFRVDSPMKGKASSEDESKLSFQVATIDTSAMRMTVRECLWNQGQGVAWGASKTVSLNR
jgi:hypothetical protein